MTAPAPGTAGIIPLRPLSLTDIFNGSVAYVRANPRATLGLTTAVVVTITVLGFVVVVSASTSESTAQAVAGAALGALATLLAAGVLSGMLTTIVARSVLGAPITVSEAWRRARSRIGALLGLTALEILCAAALIAAAGFAIAGVARTAGALPATLLGVPLVALLAGGLTYAGTMLVLAPVVIVLEQRTVLDAVHRSLSLSRRRFWRTLGVLMLAGVVAVLVTGAVSIPFDIAGSVVSFSAQPRSSGIVSTMMTTIGQAVGQIITAPFIAGVITLLYVDARIRLEAFDFTLLRAPAGTPGDDLWPVR